jgi:hypothetical protein
MPSVFTDYIEPMRFDVGLDGGRYVTGTVSHYHLLDAELECVQRDVHKAFRLRRHFANGDRDGRIPHKSLQDGSAIYADDVPFFQASVSGNSVHQLFVDADGRGCWIWKCTRNTYKGGYSLVLP